ncbi:MAG: hypothetical protein LQ338_006320 [Usnochroma carphineum]|nr:MAG: hypothetical protein LQ338_006320 [Usnochroma carphineum]
MILRTLSQPRKTNLQTHCERQRQVNGSASQRMEEEGDVREAVLRNTIAEVQGTSKSTSKTIDACVICLDSISERAAASPCKHDSFDFLCLVSWLQERSTCPLCKEAPTLQCRPANDAVGKAEVLAVDYGWQSPQGCKTYRVPRHGEQGQAAAPLLNQAARTISTRPRAWTNRGPRRSAGPRLPVSPDAALLRRRQIYAHGLYSLHVGTNRLSRFRDLTPQLFSRDVELVSRARKWIRRELQVFDFLNTDAGEEEGVIRRANNAEFLLEYIVAILKTVDIKGSGGQAEDMLQEFLGREDTQLFLHELKAWLRSPYTSLEDWDRHVQYAEDPARDSRMAKSRNTNPRGTERSQPQSTTISMSSPSFHSSENLDYPRGDRYRPYPSRTSWRERTYHQDYVNR